MITGAPRRDPEGLGVFNSIFALNDRGEVIEYYDKAHLVPFGEYVPLSEYLPINKITAGSIQYRPGKGVRTIRLSGLPPISFLVCYEIIFGGAVVNSLDRPAAIFNLTNDSWYGATSGPHQHLANARVRAVEEGLPVIRAAYTGISATFDPFGRVIGMIPLNERGYLDVILPKPIKQATLYASWGDCLYFVILAFVTMTSVCISFRHRTIQG